MDLTASDFYSIDTSGQKTHESRDYPIDLNDFKAQ